MSERLTTRQGLALAIQLNLYILLFLHLYSHLEQLNNFARTGQASAYFTIIAPALPNMLGHYLLLFATALSLKRNWLISNAFLLAILISIQRQVTIDLNQYSNYKWEEITLISMVPFYLAWALLTLLSLLHWGLLLKGWIGRRKHSREDPWAG